MDTIWKETDLDLLDREPFVEQLMQIVNARSNDEPGISFAIDGEWGVGKSTVLTMFEQKAREENIVFHYNAWENDFYEEPLIAMLSVFADALRNLETITDKAKYFKKGLLKKVADALLCVSGQLSRHLLGVDVVNIIQQLMGEAQKAQSAKYNELKLDDKIILKSSLMAIKEQLKKVTDVTKIIVVVDELDRCLPEYAIKVLERIHHMFLDTKGYIIVVSVDKRQLENTIIKIFGEKIDLDSYLKKFIDFNLCLGCGDLNDKFNDLLQEYISLFKTNVYEFEKLIEKDWLINLFKGINIRERLKLLSKAMLIHKTFIAPQFAECDITIMYFELFTTVMRSYCGLDFNSLFRGDTGSDNNNKKTAFRSFYKTLEQKVDATFYDRLTSKGIVPTCSINLKKTLENLLSWYFTQFKKRIEHEHYEFLSNPSELEPNIEIIKKYYDYLDIVQ